MIFSFSHKNIYMKLPKQFHPLIEFSLKYQKITKQSIKEKEIAKVTSLWWGHLQG